MKSSQHPTKNTLFFCLLFFLLPWDGLSESYAQGIVTTVPGDMHGSGAPQTVDPYEEARPSVNINPSIRVDPKNGNLVDIKNGKVVVQGCNLQKFKGADAAEYRSCKSHHPLPPATLAMLQQVIGASQKSSEEALIHAGNQEAFKRVIATLPTVATPNELKLLEKLKAGSSDLKEFCSVFMVDLHSEICTKPEYRKILVDTLGQTRESEVNSHFLKKETEKIADEMAGKVGEMYKACTYGKPKEARDMFLEDESMTPYFLSDAFENGREPFEKFVAKDFGKDSPPDGYRGMQVNHKADSCQKTWTSVCTSVCGFSANCEQTSSSGSISCDMTALGQKIDAAKEDFRETALKELKIAGLNETPDFGGEADTKVPGYGSNLRGAWVCNKSSEGKYRSYALYHQFHQYPGAMAELRSSLDSEEKKKQLDQLYCEALQCNSAVTKSNERDFNAAKFAAIGVALIPGGAVASTVAFALIEEAELYKDWHENREQQKILQYGSLAGSYRNSEEAFKQVHKLSDKNLYNEKMAVVTAVTAVLMIKVVEPGLEKASEKVVEFMSENVPVAKQISNAIFDLCAPMQKAMKGHIKVLQQKFFQREITNLVDAEVNAVTQILMKNGVKVTKSILAAVKNHFKKTVSNGFENSAKKALVGGPSAMENEGDEDLLSGYLNIGSMSITGTIATLTKNPAIQKQSPEEIEKALEQDQPMATQK